MAKEHSAQIYKSDLRGLISSGNHSCLSTLNFGTYQHDSRKPFGILYLFNQETLASKHAVTIFPEPHSITLILPLYGGVDFKDVKDNISFIRVEQLKSIVTLENSPFELSNLFDENVSYLQIGLKLKTNNAKKELKKFNFEKRNNLITLFEDYNIHVFIGLFDGRKESVYNLKEQSNGLFVFVINGAFEFQNRLIETGDALSLSQIEFVEWEALSENAMFILFEIPLL